VALTISLIPRIGGARVRRGIWLAEANLAKNVDEDGTIKGGPDHHRAMANEQPGVQQHTYNR
jgi:hypothetical protein